MLVGVDGRGGFRNHQWGDELQQSNLFETAGYDVNDKICQPASDGITGNKAPHRSGSTLLPHDGLRHITGGLT